MSPVAFTSRLAFYEYVISGRATSQKDRIIRLLLKAKRPMTRQEIVYNHFWVGAPARATDGGPPIPWPSATGAIAKMICKEPGCDHKSCDGYLTVSHEGVCPITKSSPVEFLAPIGTKWATRRLF
jgi:hypothetical protein